MDTLKRIHRNGWYSYKALYGFLKPQEYILVKVANPIFQVIFFTLVARHAYGSGDITPYIVGNAFVLCAYNAFFGVGANLIVERNLGTLKLLVASPSNKFSIFVTKCNLHIMDGMITVFIGILTGIIIFDLSIPLNAVPQFLLCLIVAIFSACAMGLFVGSIGLVTRDINLLLNLSAMMLMCLSGVNFPVERMPIILQKASSLMPLTNSLKACRLLMGTDMTASGTISSYIVKEFALGLLYCVAAYMTLKFMEHIAKRKAVIDVY